MEIFTETAPAVSPEILEIVQDQSMGSLASQIINLKEQVDRLQRNWDYANNANAELRQKISNVKGHIFDMYSMNGSVDDDIKEIAELLDITLMKEIAGTALCEISWTAQVPLDFDADDFEISFDVSCDSYDVEEFDWTEENIEVEAEEV